MGRILVIEDEPSTQILLQSRLQDLGHEVVVAPTGAMGLMECRTQPFDLFLVDLNLGSGIDGYEVCRRLKSKPKTHAVPVVLISGQMTSREDLHRGYEAGCASFLLKGDFSLLEDVVRAMLRLKSLQDDLALQNQLLEQQNRRLQEEKQRGADLELALRETGDRSVVVRELAVGHPDGMLVVDSDGIVCHADRGARDLMGKELEGLHLGSLAQGTGLEAFVRDARYESREGFRFDIQRRGGRRPRSLTASVVPLSSKPGEGGPPLRVVLVMDASKRRVAAEMLRLQEQGIPRRELGPLLEAANLAFDPSQILGVSPGVNQVRSTVVKTAHVDSPVLIRGEPGTGKQMIARALHFGGARSGAFVPINCGALTPRILESELFGHVKGAFPDAVSDRPGLVQQAHLGTLFLEEVGELPSELQEKLLRVIDQGVVTRVGSQQIEYVDVRIVASTSYDLAAAVDRGDFLRELYMRLNVVEFDVPALRERPEDVIILAEAFLRRHGGRRELSEIDDEAAWVMENYNWPGNVRELENCIERACTLASGTSVGVGDLPQPLRDLYHRLHDEREIPRRPRTGLPLVVQAGVPQGAVVRPLSPAAASTTPVGSPASDNPYAAMADAERDEPVSLELYEKRALLRALEETGGDKLAAARLLKVGKSTLYRKLKRYDIK